jgi:hypothetical protein
LYDINRTDNTRRKYFLSYFSNSLVKEEAQLRSATDR